MEDIKTLAASLTAIVGAERVVEDPAALDHYSTDFSEIPLERAALAVRPITTEEVSRLLRAVQDAGYRAVARGGGMSYTLAFVPALPNTVLFDMTAMNRIVAIDEDDLTVTVEPGVTWAALHAAFRDRPYGMAFQGTLSGIQATVGGGLGNNAVGVGAGVIGDDLLGLEVVLPDGRIVLTGALATGAAGPLMRGYGPDFTGVFTHDAGAFGIKTRAVFRLIRKPGGTAFATFGFRDPAAAASALIDITRAGLASNAYIFAAYHHALFAGEPPPSAAVARALFRDIAAASSSRWRAVRDVAAAFRPGGLKFLRRWPYSLHVLTAGFDQGTADRMRAEVRRIARRWGGAPLPSALLLALHAQPFQPIDRLIVGKDGECSFPSNCTVPFGKAFELIAEIDAFFARNAALMAAHDIRTTRLYLTVQGLFGCEPIIYWFDRMNPLRYSVLSPERRDTVGRTPENLAARAVALDLRRRLVSEVFAVVGGAHFQIGKYYPYRETLRGSAALALLDGFKGLVDPDGRMNPGALGLGARA